MPRRPFCYRFVAGSKIARDPEANAHVGAVAGAGNAKCRTRHGGRARPGAAADDTTVAAGVDPCRAIFRGAHVAVVPAVLDPLHDVAAHVVEAEWVTGQATHWGRPPVAVGIATKSNVPAGP